MRNGMCEFQLLHSARSNLLPSAQVRPGSQVPRPAGTQVRNAVADDMGHHSKAVTKECPPPPPPPPCLPVFPFPLTAMPCLPSNQGINSKVMPMWPTGTTLPNRRWTCPLCSGTNSRRPQLRMQRPRSSKVPNDLPFWHSNNGWVVDRLHVSEQNLHANGFFAEASSLRRARRARLSEEAIRMEILFTHVKSIYDPDVVKECQKQVRSFGTFDLDPKWSSGPFRADGGG